jgi:hypothetical protein
MRLGPGAVRKSLRKFGLFFWGDDVIGAGDAGGLHMAGDVRLKGADFEVCEDLVNLSVLGPRRFDGGRESRSLAIQGFYIMR